VKLYWRSTSGDALAETDSTGSVTNLAYNEYVFFSGRRIAARNGTGSIFYYFADQLGTTRTITTGNGTGQTPGQLCYDADFTPYGLETPHTERLQTTACPPNYKFTGYERDNETELDYAIARYYSPSLNRFYSTDPLSGTIGSLQSHNAYTYVLNNPLNYVDPTGMTCYITTVDENGFTSSEEIPGANKGDCRKAGGDWIDPVTTVYVTAGGDGGSPAGGCASYYQDGVYLGNVCSGPSPGSGGGTGRGKRIGGFLTNLNKCVNNNATNYSIGGVANLIANKQLPGSGFAGNTVTDTYLLLTGQSGLFESASGAKDVGKAAFDALNKPIMTNGPNSFTTLVAQRGSPQAVLGSGTNYKVSFLGKLAKVGAELKLAVDAGLAGALVLNCSLGQIH
jgi:RHS repeat-associated protein